MADDMTDKIKEILNNPEMMNMVSSLLGSANSGVSEEKEEDITSSVKGMLSGIGSESDKRINLLNALKPYMRESRASNIDKAIKMIKLTKISSILKDL